MGSQHLSHLLNDGMTLAQRLMLSYRNWKIHDINLAATCDDIQQVLFFLRSLAYECRDIGGIDCETINVIEDNVNLCRRAIYDFETQVLSMRYRMLRVTEEEEEEEGEEEADDEESVDGKEGEEGGNAEWSFAPFMRPCPFDQAVHLAWKDVIDELQLVISVAVDVVLVVGDYYCDDRYDYADRCDEEIDCELPSPIVNGKHCVDQYPPAERLSECSDGGWHVDLDNARFWVEDMSFTPCLTKAEPSRHVGNIPLLLQLNAKDAGDFISPTSKIAHSCCFTQKSPPDIEDWLGNVTNQEAENYPAVDDSYHYDHHHRQKTIFADILDSGEEDREGSSADCSNDDDDDDDSECPSTSIIEFLDSPPRGSSTAAISPAAVDAFYQKQRIKAAERPDDWYFGDVAILVGGRGGVDEQVAEFQSGCLHRSQEGVLLTTP
ncbi:hypothetical protein AJ78_08146 [Emergomyces pasteurianus Ep9510]|uniref:Uncharacterized protein n=1 Tax=Emergomyces pasteurianus Ep9510 TaxID=1447872 RepID=A0A1J9P3N6_9EURO|nr:hypothetical protein AJ78_08146 [Emergomyces pasteurianus Ep9510]